MRLVVGLGNPGQEYATTRHNVGFRVVDELARRGSLSFRTGKWNTLAATGPIAGRSLVLLKPQTYMNDSGRAVRAAVDFYQIDPAEILVVQDDIDLPLGRLRIREHGSHGGHNGVRSIIQHLKSDAFPRLKIGVGRPPAPQAADHVLSPFRKHELPIVDETIERAADAVEVLLGEGLAAAMNRYNVAPSV